jgi:hypothetical protein
VDSAQHRTRPEVGDNLDRMAPPVSESGEGEIVADFRAHRSDGWVMAPRARRGKEADVGGGNMWAGACAVNWAEEEQAAQLAFLSLFSFSFHFF